LNGYRANLLDSVEVAVREVHLIVQHLLHFEAESRVLHEFGESRGIAGVSQGDDHVGDYMGANADRDVAWYRSTDSFDWIRRQRRGSLGDH